MANAYSFLIGAIMFVVTACSGTPGPPNPPPIVPKIFVLVGDSTMTNRCSSAGVAAALTSQPEVLYVYRTQQLSQPLLEQTVWAALGPVDSGFAQELQLAYVLYGVEGHPVGFAKIAYGGSTTDAWASSIAAATGTWVADRLATYPNDHTVGGIGLSLGINDAQNLTLANAMEANLLSVLASLRAVLGDVPAFMCLVHSGTDKPYVTEVNAGITAVASNPANKLYLCDTAAWNALPLEADNIHFPPETNGDDVPPQTGLGGLNAASVLTVVYP